MMRSACLYWCLTAVVLGGCAGAPKNTAILDQIDAEMGRATVGPAQADADAVKSALLPPLRIDMPPSAAKAAEPRFDLVVNGAPAGQVFMGIVSGTRYSMLVHPEVAGAISVNLKDVTVFEALDAIREIYGYDYKVDGTRIFIQPLGLHTRLFQINYLSGLRKGTSDIRVTSGSVGDTPTSGTSTAAVPVTTTTSGTSRTLESSKISTSSSTDFWAELKAALDAITGGKDGRSVVVSPQSGVIVVRAMSEELRNVERFLKAAQISVERQVILEAKIMEVQLNDGYQTGVNWSALNSADQHGFSVGANPKKFQVPGGAVGTMQADGSFTAGSTLGDVLGTGLPNAATTLASGMFGIAFQTGSFAALVSFLETQGRVHVLSSPRIATLNNQKAVLKVGTDEFFVTNVSSTTTTGTSTSTTPSVTLQPFFSGIALDVTPQIDESGNIILHIHPSVSQVSTVTKEVDLGSVSGTLKLPLASSAVSETDSIVRARNGRIVAIGGLMKQQVSDDRSQVPALGDIPLVGPLFKHTSQATQKRELVILVKPTVIQNGAEWVPEVQESQRRMQQFGSIPSRETGPGAPAADRP